MARSIAAAKEVGRAWPLPKHPGMGERGFDTIQLGMVIVVLVLIGGAVWGVNSYLTGVEKKGYDRGVAETTLRAEEARKRRDAEVAGALDMLAKRWGTAQAEAEQATAKWQEARNADRGKQLGVCEVQGPSKAAPRRDPPVAGEPAGTGVRQAGVAGGDRAGVRLLWRFVGLYDGAHGAGDGGQPVFGATQAYALAPERTDTASPYGLDDLIDVHADNAWKWAECRRDLNAAIDAVEAAERAWGAKR